MVVGCFLCVVAHLGETVTGTFVHTNDGTILVHGAKNKTIVCKPKLSGNAKKAPNNDSMKKPSNDMGKLLLPSHVPGYIAILDHGSGTHYWQNIKMKEYSFDLPTAPAVPEPIASNPNDASAVDKADAKDKKDKKSK